MKLILVLAFLAVAGSVSYYYTIELPKENRDRLALEQRKYDDEQAQKTAAKVDEESRHTSYLVAVDFAQSEKDTCQSAAIKKYNDALAANGTPDPDRKGFYTGSRELFKEIQDEEDNAMKACDAEYMQALETAKSQWQQK